MAAIWTGNEIGCAHSIATKHQTGLGFKQQNINENPSSQSNVPPPLYYESLLCAFLAAFNLKRLRPKAQWLTRPRVNLGETLENNSLPRRGCGRQLGAARIRHYRLNIQFDFIPFLWRLRRIARYGDE